MSKDQKGNIQSIKYITVFPKRKDRWKYFLNNNFKDSYTLKTKDLVHFIFSISDSSISEDINKYISTYAPFLVDVENLRVHHLTVSLEQAQERYVNNYWKKEKNVDNVLKSFRESERKRTASTHEVPYAKQNEKLLDKFTFME